jgi:hypothetical protein
MAPIIATPDQILERGLSLVNYSLNRQHACRETLLRRFRGHFGSNPIAYAEIFIDIQTKLPQAECVVGESLSLDYFLIGIHFLKCYPTEEQQSAIFQVDEKTARRWTKFYIGKIHALKAQKVSCCL